MSKGKPLEVRFDGDDEKYRMTVLHVVERDSDGSPRTFRIVRDDEKVDVSSGKEVFFIVYAPDSMTRRMH